MVASDCCDQTARSPSSSSGKRAAPSAGGAPTEGVTLIDIGPFLAADVGGLGGELPEGAKEAARRWRAAFSRQGFAQIVGHGVPDDVIEAAYACARRFFAQSLEEKKRCDSGKGYGPAGYTAQGVERVSATASKPDGADLLGAGRARPPDRVESFVFKNREGDPMPESVEGFGEAVDAYHHEMLRLLRSIMRLTACSLDLPADYFEPHYFGEGDGPRLNVVGDVTLKLSLYPRLSDSPAPLPGQLRYGEHTDYTGFTILWQDHNTSGPQTAREGLSPPEGGLQVRMPDGAWADCPPVPGAFTINAGDLIQVWTNDVFLSNSHRVLNPPAGDPHERLSMVFFTGPANSTVVEALPTCVGPNRPAKYAPISAGEHLMTKLSASNK